MERNDTCVSIEEIDSYNTKDETKETKNQRKKGQRTRRNGATAAAAAVRQPSNSLTPTQSDVEKKKVPTPRKRTHPPQRRENCCRLRGIPHLGDVHLGPRQLLSYRELRLPWMGISSHSRVKKVAAFSSV